MIERLRRARGSAVVLALALLAAWLAYEWVASFDPRPWTPWVVALIPLVMPGLPAALMLQATVRHGSPYDVRYRYRPESVGPPE